MTTWTSKYAKAFALETIKDQLKKTMVPVLKGLGVKRVNFLADRNISIWDVPELRAQIQALINPHQTMFSSLINRFDSEDILDIMEEVINEECPEFSNLPRSWGKMNIERWLAEEA